jgi:hypothetical protein
MHVDRQPAVSTFVHHYCRLALQQVTKCAQAIQATETLQHRSFMHSESIKFNFAKVFSIKSVALIHLRLSQNIPQEAARATCPHLQEARF